MDPSLQFKLQLYQNQPNFFNDDELDLLKEQLTTAGAEKGLVDSIGHASNGRDSNFNLGRTIANVVEGAVEGATTLDFGFTESRNTADEIGRSIGNLAGFIGTLPGPGLLVKGLGLAAKGLKAANLGKAALTVGKGKKALESSKFLNKMGMMDEAGDLKTSLPIFSVSKKFSDKVMGSKMFKSKHDELAKSYAWLKKGTESEKIIHEAINLGLMSGASTLTVNPFNWKENLDETMKATASGAVAGGAFGGIGAVVKLGKGLHSAAPGVAKASETTLKAFSGAAVQGMLMHSGLPEDAEIPTAMQVYEYLLGAYFGAKSTTALERTIGTKGRDVKEGKEKDIPFDEIINKETYTPEAIDKLNKIYDQRTTRDVVDALLMEKRKLDVFEDSDYPDVRVMRGKYAGKDGKLMSVSGTDKGFFNLDIDGKEIRLKGKQFEYKKSNEDTSYYRSGESLTAQNNKAQNDALHNLEDFVLDGNASVNRNIETAAYQIQSLNKSVGIDLTKRETIHIVNEALRGKNSNQLDEVTAALQKMFPQALEKADIKQGEKIARSLQNYLKGKQDVRTIPIYHMNFKSNGPEPMIEPYGYLNKKGQIVHPKNRAKTSWEGDLKTKQPWTYSEITGREGSWYNEKEQKTVKATSNLFREDYLYNHKAWLVTDKKTIDKNKLKKYIQARNDHVKRHIDLSNRGMFSLGGVGEKERIVFTDLQYPSVVKNTKQANAPREYLVNSLGEKDAKAFTTLLDNHLSYVEAFHVSERMPFGEKELARAKYDYFNAAASKMQFLEHINGGKTFVEMQAANKLAVSENKPKPYIDDLISLNKRMPLIHGMEPSWSPRNFNHIADVVDNKLNVVIADTPLHKIKSSVLNEKMLDNHYDGIYMLRSDVFDSYLNDGGLPRKVNSGKGTLYSTNREQGLLLGKYAYHRADKEMSQDMHDGNIHGELHNTSAKQLGERKRWIAEDGGTYKEILKWDKNGEPLEFGDSKKGIIAAEQIPIKDHRTNLGVYENPETAMKGATSALQRWELNWSPYIGKAEVVENGVKRKMNHGDIRDAFDALTKKNFIGDPEFTKILKKESWTPEEVLQIEKADIEQLGIQEVVNIAASSKDSPMYKALWDKLHRKFDEISDLASENIMDMEIRDKIENAMSRRSTADAILKYGEITPGIINHKWVHRYANMVLRNYILKRVNKPIEDNSSKHIGIPYTRTMQKNKSTAGLQPGEAFLLKGASKARVEYDGNLIEIRDLLTKRGELELQSKNFPKKAKGNKELINEIDEALSVVTLRVPADNISGQRVIRIKKILDEEGTGIVMHPEDMHFSGGMDLDIDGVFMYRGTPKPFKDAIRLNKDMMGGDFNPTGKEAQKRWLDKGGLLGLTPEQIKNNPALMLDPLSSERISMNLANNNKNLGVAVNNGQLLGRAVDAVTQRPLQEYTISGGSRIDGMKIRFVLKRGYDMDSFGKIITEVTNMYADAGKFGKLLSREQLLEKMWEESGLMIVGKMKDGSNASEAISLHEEIFKGSVFGAANEFKQTLKGVRWVNNEKVQLTIQDIKDAGKEFLRRVEVDGVEDIMPGTLISKARRVATLSDLSKAFMRDIDPIKYKAVKQNMLKKILERWGKDTAEGKLIKSNYIQGHPAEMQGGKVTVDQFRDYYSKDLDMMTTFTSLERKFKVFDDVFGEKSKDVLKQLLNSAMGEATELQVAWQAEKKENFKNKMSTNSGILADADVIRNTIKERAEYFESEYLMTDNLTIPEGFEKYSAAQRSKLGKLKRDIFYDLLGSNIVLGRANNISAKLEKEGEGLHAIDRGKADLDLIYTLDSIPPEHLIAHFKQRNRIEKGLMYSVGDPIKFMLGDAKVPQRFKAIKQELDSRLEQIEGYRKGKARQEWFDKIKDELPDHKEGQALMRDLDIILDRNPTAMQEFEQVFAGVTSRPYASLFSDMPIGVDFKNATTNDIRKFIGFYKRGISAEDWVTMKSGGDPELKLGFMEYLKFPETIIDRVGPHDINYFPKKGLVYSDKKIVEVDMKVPMSRFSKMSKENQSASEIATGLTDQINTFVSEPTHGWINSLPGNVQSALQRAAWGLIEKNYKGIERPETYVEGYKEYQDILEAFKNESYIINTGTESKKYTFKKLVEKHAKDYKKFMKDIDENILHNDMPWYSEIQGQGYLINNSDGTPNLKLTIEQRVKPLVDGTFRESIDTKGYNMDKATDNDKLMKTLELWKRLDRAKERNGEVVLMRDLEKLDNPAYLKYLHGGKTIGKKTYKGIIEEIDLLYGLGKIGEESYMPHMNHPKKVIEEYRLKKSSGKTVEGALDEITTGAIETSATTRADGGAMVDYQSQILHQNDRGVHRLTQNVKSAHSKSGNFRKRVADLPGYEKSLNVVTQYTQQLLKARYNALMALSNSNTIRNFDKGVTVRGNPLMGTKENQEHWGRFMRLSSLKDSGGAHILPEHWLSDKSFKINPLYSKLTEGELHKTLKKMGRWFGKDKEGMFLPEDADGEKTPQALADRLNWLSNLEARISTSTLLANTRGFTYNMVGGSTNTTISTGLKPFIKAFDYKHLRNVIPRPEGTSAADLKKPDTRGYDWFVDWAKKHGVIETFWTHELASNPAFRTMKGKETISAGLGRDLGRAWKEMRGKNIEESSPEGKRTVMEVLKKYNLDTKFADAGGYFMKKAEVQLRLRSFLAHYLKAREVFAAKGVTFKADDPALIEVALKGVTATQYLYNNTARPMFTSSPMGRVFTRFQLWAGNSMRMRKDLYQMASADGLTQNTESKKKFERMMAADMFMFAMAGLIPYSMFDATLPPPYNYYTEISQMLYGTPQEKERAFFGTLPYPANILGLVTPPSGRYITQPLGNLMTGDWDRFWDYQIYNMFPFGMLLKTGKDVVADPLKAVDKITGFPLYRLNYMSKKEDKDE